MIGFGQGWVKIYNSPECEAFKMLETTSDSGFILLGVIRGFGTPDGVTIIKTDFNGNIEWKNDYFNQFSLASIKEINSGGYIVTGSESGQPGPVFVMKLDDNGTTLWKKHPILSLPNTGVYGESIQPTNDNGFIIGCDGNNTGDTINYIFKVDSLGNLEWDKIFNDSLKSSRTRVIQLFDGNYLAYGQISETISTPLHIEKSWLIKLDINGNVIWEKKYSIICGDVIQCLDGNIIISGVKSFITGGGNEFGGQAALLKLDVYGDTLWYKSYDGFGLLRTAITYDSGYVSLNFIDTLNNGCKLYKMDKFGDTLFTRDLSIPIIGMGNMGPVSDIGQAKDGGYIIGTSVEDSIYPSSLIAVALLKLNNIGTSTYEDEMDFLSQEEILIKIVDLLGRETKGKKNEPLFYIYDDGTVEKRITIE
tara:strand:- start:168 stop:1427 length:1260 start_codon:yes stop_codon:yes gene_type:complete